MNAHILRICLVIFVISVGVRVLIWQNNKVEMSGVQWVLTHIYRADARELALGRLGLFLAGPNSPSDANVLLHPPGYSILIAGVGSIVGDGNGFRIVQICLNSLAPVLVFLIGLQLFGQRTGIIASLGVAFAPQFAYHSGLMLPDGLSVVPILAALYCLVRARETPSILLSVLCGVALAVSCWLRPNALLLPLFFAAATFCWLPKASRSRFAAILLAVFALTIAPITIRNYVVFNAFIPLSLGAGTTFLEGLGDYDVDGTGTLPVTDEDVMLRDVQRSGRADHYGFLYRPDGVERERERILDGLAVVVEHPFRYGMAVAHRGASTFRMERVPAIAAERDERETTPPVFYYLNLPLKFFQGFFITAVVLPLAIAGLFLVILDRERRNILVLLAAIPLYYGTIQALIHTEYRYVLATPHILMILAAVALSWLIDRLNSIPRFDILKPNRLTGPE